LQVQRICGGTEQAGAGMGDGHRGNLRHRRGEPALAFKTLAEAGVLQLLQQARYQAAGQEHAVPRALYQYCVAGDGAEDFKENFNCTTRQRIAFGGACTDLGGLQQARIGTRYLADGAMDVDQAGAADQAFVGNPAWSTSIAPSAR